MGFRNGKSSGHCTLSPQDQDTVSAALGEPGDGRGRYSYWLSL